MTGHDVEELSSALFGNRHLARVLSAAGDRHDSDDLCTVRRLAADTCLIDSVVRPVVLRLVAAGVLHALPRDRARGEHFYMLQDGPLVAAALAAAREVTAARGSAEAPAGQR